jgi:hypothetical protein
LESAKGVHGHTHDPEFRKQVSKERQASLSHNGTANPDRSELK